MNGWTIVILKLFDMHNFILMVWFFWSFSSAVLFWFVIAFVTVKELLDEMPSSIGIA